MNGVRSSKALFSIPSFLGVLISQARQLLRLGLQAPKFLRIFSVDEIESFQLISKFSQSRYIRAGSYLGFESKFRLRRLTAKRAVDLCK